MWRRPESHGSAWLSGLDRAASDRATQVGAKGYLLKDAPREALMDCIRRVHAVETLSEAEIDVLLAQGKSNKEIGSARFISEGTVKSHVKASSPR